MCSCTQYLPMGKPFVNPKDIYHKVTSEYSCGMTIYEVRRNNLALLIKDRFEGKQKKLADAIDRQPDYISRILKGTKNVGETFARHVEESLGLPEQSLDLPDSPAMGPTARLKREELLKKIQAEEEDQGRSRSRVRFPIDVGTDVMQRSVSHDELEFFGHMDAWDSDTPLDPDEVELPLFREVELAAGAGATEVIENHGCKLRFAKSTLSRAGVPAESAACAFVRGNSMEPVMPDNTCVGVNTADKIIRDGEIYAIDHGGMLRVKYLHRRPGGGIKIVSQNSMEHPVEELTAEEVAQDVKIIGRVFWWSVLR